MGYRIPQSPDDSEYLNQLNRSSDIDRDQTRYSAEEEAASKRRQGANIGSMMQNLPRQYEEGADFQTRQNQAAQNMEHARTEEQRAQGRFGTEQKFNDFKLGEMEREKTRATRQIAPNEVPAGMYREGMTQEDVGDVYTRQQMEDAHHMAGMQMQTAGLHNKLTKAEYDQLQEQLARENLTQGVVGSQVAGASAPAASSPMMSAGAGQIGGQDHAPGWQDRIQATPASMQWQQGGPAPQNSGGALGASEEQIKSYMQKTGKTREQTLGVLKGAQDQAALGKQQNELMRRMQMFSDPAMSETMLNANRQKAQLDTLQANLNRIDQWQMAGQETRGNLSDWVAKNTPIPAYTGAQQDIVRETAASLRALGKDFEPEAQRVENGFAWGPSDRQAVIKKAVQDAINKLSLKVRSQYGGDIFENNPDVQNLLRKLQSVTSQNEHGSSPVIFQSARGR